MKEANIRNVHAKLGLILAVLLTLQALSGMLLAAGALVGSHEDAHEHGAAQGAARGDATAARDSSGAEEAKAQGGLETIVKAVHLGGGEAGMVYRILLILAYLVQMGMGVAIYARVRSRKAKA